MDDESDLAAIELRARLEQETEIAARKKDRAERLARAQSEVAPLELPDVDDVAELLKIADPVTIKMLYKMANDENTPAATRVRASEIILSYSRGKPSQENNKKQNTEEKPTKIGAIKQKILKAIPNDKLDAILSELHNAGAEEGEGTETLQQD